ncbi:MAG: rRNA maturation RNase YbeY [Lachnospiraceae bacterium]|nr:rRNA maturation RNase YbeY [Lachnospiraceae bacterium]
MTALVETEVQTAFDFDHQALFTRVLTTVLEAERCPYEVSVSLFITDDEEIRRLNRENRDIDRPTDVLSFPLVAFSSPACYDGLEEDPDNFDPDTGELLLGDIVLSQDRIIAQADAYGHSREREYAFLIVHSLLHLLGYDHLSEEERAVMEKRQEEIMERLGISRE